MSAAETPAGLAFDDTDVAGHVRPFHTHPYLAGRSEGHAHPGGQSGHYHGSANHPPERERPESFELRAWRDTVVESHGHRVTSPYCEAFWLPILGPSALWALRRFAALLTAEPNGVIVGVDDLGWQMGLGRNGGKRSRVMHMVDRLAKFDAVSLRPGCGEVHARSHLATLPERHVRQLAPSLRSQHDSWAAKGARP